MWGANLEGQLRVEGGPPSRDSDRLRSAEFNPSSGRLVKDGNAAKPHPIASAKCASPPAALRQTLRQRLRLGDLGHFRGRLKAFEHRREHGVGFGGAASRLIKLREREGGAEFEAARAL
jgi:hypothetical protein